MGTQILGCPGSHGAQDRVGARSDIGGNGDRHGKRFANLPDQLKRPAGITYIDDNGRYGIFPGRDEISELSPAGVVGKDRRVRLHLSLPKRFQQVAAQSFVRGDDDDCIRHICDLGHGPSAPRTRMHRQYGAFTHPSALPVWTSRRIHPHSPLTVNLTPQ